MSQELPRFFGNMLSISDTFHCWWPLLRGVMLSLFGLLCAGCASQPPREVDDVCAIFEEKPDWYEFSKEASDRWGVPIHVQMAILRQESSFESDVKPPRRKLLWVIPWTRASSAYGYAQAKDSTWDWYIEKSGNRGADRDDFADAVDFVAWYVNTSYRMLGISKWDTYSQYLAYHEGQGGFKRRTYQRKPWLIRVARRVNDQAKRYSIQLASCQDDLKKSGWSLWPF